MAAKTTRQEQLFPGTHDVPLRQALSGALPGLLHHLDHWFAMRYFPLQKEDSLHPEQPYTALGQLYQQVIREVRSALTSWRNPWIPAPRCICVAMQNDTLYHEVRHEVLKTSFSDCCHMMTDNHISSLEKEENIVYSL